MKFKKKDFLYLDVEGEEELNNDLEGLEEFEGNEKDELGEIGSDEMFNSDEFEDSDFE